MARICGLLALLVGCQEYTIENQKVEPTEPVDTDIAAPALLPDIEVFPETLDFGDYPIDCESDPLTVTITNVGEANLDIQETVIAGPQASAYTVLNPGSGNVRPGESVTINVVFHPTGDTEYDNASLRIRSNDPDEGTVHVFADGQGTGNAYREDLFTQEISNDLVDVLFVIDDSESMANKLSALANAMDTFIQQFMQLGLDYHIGVTTTDMTSSGAQGALLGPVITNFTQNPVAEFSALVNQGATGSANERGFAAAETALSAPRINQVPNSTFLRSDANLAIMVISDEDDADANPLASANGYRSVTNSFINFVLSLKSDPGDVSFSAFVGPPNSGCAFQAPQTATRAPEYHRAINGTGGVWGNLCYLNVTPFLNNLALVVAGLDSRFTLSSVPSETTCDELTVQVDGNDVPCGEFTYHPSTNEVEIHEGYVPEEGQGVVITYPLGEGCP
jgi:hypothetical protein